MCFFSKRKNASKVLKDRTLIETNSKAIEALIVLAQDNDELIKELKEVQEKLKYLAPSQNDQVRDGDVKISEIIHVLREELTESNGKTTESVKNLLKSLKLAVVDRNTIC